MSEYEYDSIPIVVRRKEGVVEFCAVVEGHPFAFYGVKDGDFDAYVAESRQHEAERQQQQAQQQTQQPPPPDQPAAQPQPSQPPQA